MSTLRLRPKPETYSEVYFVTLVDWKETHAGWYGTTDEMRAAHVKPVLFPKYAWEVFES